MNSFVPVLGIENIPQHSILGTALFAQSHLSLVTSPTSMALPIISLIKSFEEIKKIKAVTQAEQHRSIINAQCSLASPCQSS